MLSNPIIHSADGSSNRVSSRTRSGFSLIELVVVILILGVIAAIAAPRMFNTADEARSNSTRQSLAVIRNAIEIYNVHEGDYPPNTDSATFKAALRKYLNSPIPVPSSVAGKNSDILMDATAAVDGDGNSVPEAAPDDGEDAGWVYKKSTGSFKINTTANPEAGW